MKRLDYDLYEGKYTEVHNKDNNNLFVEGDIENGQIKKIEQITDHEGNELIEYAPELKFVYDNDVPSAEPVYDESPLDSDLLYGYAYIQESVSGVFTATFDGQDAMIPITINFKKGTEFQVESYNTETDTSDYYLCTFKEDYSVSGSVASVEAASGTDMSYTIPTSILYIEKLQ